MKPTQHHQIVTTSTHTNLHVNTTSPSPATNFPTFVFCLLTCLAPDVSLSLLTFRSPFSLRHSSSPCIFYLVCCNNIHITRNTHIPTPFTSTWLANQTATLVLFSVSCFAPECLFFLALFVFTFFPSLTQSQALRPVQCNPYTNNNITTAQSIALSTTTLHPQHTYNLTVRRGKWMHVVQYPLPLAL